MAPDSAQSLQPSGSERHQGGQVMGSLRANLREDVCHVVDDESDTSWVTAWLASTNSLAYFLVYFLRYPIFMLPDEILRQTAMVVFGVHVALHEALSLVFCLGFGLAKVPGVKVMTSDWFFNNRYASLALLNIATATFATLPLALSRGSPLPTTVGLFMACFPTSWVYGGMLTYVEGRRATEAILAFGVVAFVFGGSASRGTALYVLNAGLDPYWMPAFVSGIVLVPTLLLLWLLDKSPAPTAHDMAQRQRRRSMSGVERHALFQQFWPGLVCIIIFYTLLTALRQFRDLFNRSIFTAANAGVPPSSTVFFFVDLPGAAVSSVIVLFIGRFEDNAKALKTMVLIMIALVLVMILSTAMFFHGWLDSTTWQIAVGVGMYGSYAIASNGALWDRLVAVAQMPGATCTFLVYLADLCGYGGAIALLVWKTFGAGPPSMITVLQQFQMIVFVFGVAMVLCLGATFVYFHRRLSLSACEIDAA